MNVLDLFSGIGGFSLGLERAGFTTVAFCEIEPYPRAVLKKHWPHVPCYEDVCKLTGQRLKNDGIVVDVICGGFPCQGISPAGKGKGLDDPRSGLWSEYARLIGELRPLWVIVENSARLRTLGADRVLGDMEALGYTCWPFVVGAAHAGAPHRRARTWILAYSYRPRELQPQGSVGAQREWVEHCSALLANGNGRDQQRRSSALQVGRGGIAGAAAHANHGNRTQWAAEPSVGRVVYGVPSRIHRLTALGNAVVPQIPEAIGRVILQGMAGQWP